MGRKGIYPPSVKPGIPKLGQQPRGWRKVAFGDILDVAVRPAVVKDTNVYHLVVAKRNRGGIVPRESLYGRDILTKTQFYVAAGDFLISNRQIVHGACGIVPKSLDGALVSNEYTTLLARKDLLLEYLGWLSHSTHFQKTCFHSSVGVDVEKMVFRGDKWMREELYLPPLSEQKTICDMLGAWDLATEQSKELIRAKVRFGQALAQKLLSNSSTKGWEEFSLDELCDEIGSGGTPSTKIPGHWRGSIPWITGADISDEGVEQARRHITMAAVEQSSTRLCAPGTVLLVTRTNVGKITLAPFEMAISQDITALEPKAKLIGAPFLLISLATSMPRLLRFNQGTAISGITRKMLIRHRIRVPSLQEQKNISDALGAVEREVSLLRKRLALWEKQRMGLLQKLVSGDSRI